MTERTMRGLLRSAAFCAPLLVLVPSLAWAQTQAIDPNLTVRRDGEALDNGTLVYAKAADCGGDPATGEPGPGTEFTFSAQYPTNVAFAELWLGVEQDCTTAANRIKQQNNTALPVCTFLGRDNNNSRNPTIKVAGRRLFQRTPTDGTGSADVAIPSTLTDKVKCDELHGTPKYTVYFIPLTVAGTATQASPPAMVGTISTLKATFSPFTTRPDAPTGLSGVSGENRLEVNFKSPSSSVPLTKYRAYFDTNQGGGGNALPTEDAGSAGGMDGGLMDASVVTSGDAGTSDTSDGTQDEAGSSTAQCGSGVLVAGHEAPTNRSGIIRTSASDSKTAVLTDLSAVALNSSVAVSAVAIDPAGNESFLSAPICVTRKVTRGFLDECRAAGEGNCGLDSCSLHPTNQGSAISIALFALALAALIRRRGRA